MVQIMKINIQREADKISLYLTKKEAWKYGYIRYSQFKNIIIHITKIKSTYLLRKLFLYLVDTGIFIKRKNLVRSYLYKFDNKNEPKIIKRTVTIDFE